MISFFANIFGYILNFIYSIINNYGIAVILFSVLLKIVLLPLSIKQQKTMKKTEKLQKEMSALQVKYKNNQEKLNQEMMDLYKRNNMNPFTGCLGPIIQIILLFAVFSLVREPLTYMLHINNNEIAQMTQYIKEDGKVTINQTYPQISVLQYVANNIKNNEEMSPEIQEKLKEKNLDLKKFYINMDFLGLDLSDVPQQNYKDYKVFIIPILYVISSVISIKIATPKQNVGEEEEKNNAQEMAVQMNKNMSFMMPLLSVMVSLIAPLGLALYWLTNNILMIFERIILDKFIDKEETV